MLKKAKKYTAEEKAQIAIEALRGELTIAQISSKFGVHSTQIGFWKKQALQNLIEGFKCNKSHNKNNDEELIKQLYEQIGQLTVERDWLKKNLLSLDLEVRRDMICTNNLININKQCALLSVNRSSFYYKAKNLSPSDLIIMNRIDEIYTLHPYYGTRRMSKCLEEEGFSVGRKAMRRYYNIMALKAIYPKVNLSKRNQSHKIYPYLLKNISIERVNQVWSADITYIRLTQGFVYLVAIIDWYSRYILSWKISNTLDAIFCIDALKEAINNYGAPDIFNTDQGAQFTSHEFTTILKSYSVNISMDGKGRALDNIIIERFWRSLKQEKLYLLILNTIIEVKNAINNYIIFYNTERLHQSLGYMTPKDVYLNGKIN